jgi:hypothetical protein
MLPVMDRGIWVNSKSSWGYEANRIDEQGESYSASSPGLRFPYPNLVCGIPSTIQGWIFLQKAHAKSSGNAAAFAIKSLSNQVVMTRLVESMRRSFSHHDSAE